MATKKTAPVNENNNTTILTIDDGSKRYELKNQFGQLIGEFIIRPGDIGIFSRFQQMQDEIEEIGKPLEDIDIGADGNAENVNDAKAVAVLDEAKDKLFAVVNKLFACEIADRLFGSMHPFSPVNGRFYFEHVLEVIGKVIDSEFGAEATRMNARVQKYIK